MKFSMELYFLLDEVIGANRSFYTSMCMSIFYHRLTYAIIAITCINGSNSCNIPLNQDVTGKTEEANKMIDFFP